MYDTDPESTEARVPRGIARMGSLLSRRARLSVLATACAALMALSAVTTAFAWPDYDWWPGSGWHSVFAPLSGNQSTCTPATYSHTTFVSTNRSGANLWVDYTSSYGGSSTFPGAGSLFWTRVEVWDNHGGYTRADAPPWWGGAGVTYDNTFGTTIGQWFSGPNSGDVVVVEPLFQQPLTYCPVFTEVIGWM